MKIVNDMTGQDVTEWLDRCLNDPYVQALQWQGKAAEDMGLSGEADPDMARRVLCDGVGPGGEELTKFTTIYERADGMTYLPDPIVSYLLRFWPHKTVRSLLTDPAKREAVLAAHWVAVKAAVMLLEEDMELEVVGVEARYYSGAAYGDPDDVGIPVLASEVVVAASGRYTVFTELTIGTFWHPLDTVLLARRFVIPGAESAFTTYQVRLGRELARRLGVEVAYEPSPQTSLPIAVMSS